MRWRYVTNFSRPAAQNHHFCAFVCCRLCAASGIACGASHESQVPSAERGDLGWGFQLQVGCVVCRGASSELTVSPGRAVLGERCGSTAKAGRAGPLHCLGAVVDLEFGEYVAYVVADGF